MIGGYAALITEAINTALHEFAIEQNVHKADKSKVGNAYQGPSILTAQRQQRPVGRTENSDRDPVQREQFLMENAYGK